MTWEALRRELREQLLAQRVRGRRVVRRSTVTEAEVDQYLAQNREKFEAGLKYHAFHIAITVERAELSGSVGPGEAGRSRASRPRWPAAPTSPSWRGRAARTRRAAIWAGWPGVSWIRPSSGRSWPSRRGRSPPRSGPAPRYHLFKLDEREELTADRLADARQQGRDLLLQKKAQERFDEWLEGLRRRALIAIRL